VLPERPRTRTATRFPAQQCSVTVELVPRSRDVGRRFLRPARLPGCATPARSAAGWPARRRRVFRVGRHGGTARMTYLALLRMSCACCSRQARQGSNPDRRGWSSSCSQLHHGPTHAKRTTRLERASPSWQPGALPSELRPREYARLDSNQRPLPSQSSALNPLSYERMKEPPAGVEPAPRPYKGRVLAVDTTEA
jgi:hypothetical protein